jgi:hypothetical protein
MMMYRVVRASSVKNGSEPETVAEFESAYTALDWVRQAVARRQPGAARWRVVDGRGLTLVDSVELFEARPSTDASVDER